MRVFVVEDVPLARERIRLFLAEEPDVELVGEADTVRAAVSAIPLAAPDLVLLDVRLPDGDGFNVVERLPAESRPIMVFLTAHGDHAVSAFEVDAADYILKPVSRERLQRALARARLRLNVRRRGLRNESPGSRLALNGGNGIELVDISRIVRAEADGHYVHLHTLDGTRLLRLRLSTLEKRLDSSLFARVHRSHLVCLDHVRRIQPRRNGDCDLILCDGTELTLSRTYRSDVERRLGIRAFTMG